CISFSSDRKRMSTLVPIKGGGGARRVYTKGASEVVLELCSRIAQPGGEVATAMDAGARARFDEAIGKMADEGLRTLTVAYREIAAGEEEPKDLEEDLKHAKKEEPKDLEEDLILLAVAYREIAAGEEEPKDLEEDLILLAVLGLEDPDLEDDLILLAVLGLEDPVRPEVPGAIHACKEAGIVVRMVTGVRPEVPGAIRACKEAGIVVRMVTGDNARTVLPVPFWEWVALRGEEARRLYLEDKL
ncbi:P-type ATPase, partial [Baffinella frigidus]